MTRLHLLLVLLPLLAAWPRMAVGEAAGDAATAFHLTPHVRRPVAAALCDEGRVLCVVNHRSGSVSLIDPEARAVTAEVRLGENLSDIAVLPDGKTLLITDEAKHELLIARPTQTGIDVARRLPTPRTPVQVTVSNDVALAAVACLWSHRVALISQAATDDDPDRPFSDLRVVRLPFAPRMLAFVAGNAQLPQGEESFNIEHQEAAVGDQSGRGSEPPKARSSDLRPPTSAARLIAADAFGGNIAVIDPAAGEVESVRELPAHNIRGMAVSEDEERPAQPVCSERGICTSHPVTSKNVSRTNPPWGLLVSHQVLNPLARSDLDDVHWGNLMQNVIRELSVSTLLDPEADLLDGSRRIRLGQTGNAAADPAGIAVLTGIQVDRPDGIPWIVALSGVGEVAVAMNSTKQRDQVGARPLDIVWDEARKQAYAICSLDDSVAVIGAEDPVNHAISLGPQPEPTPPDRGERLFFDGRRSHDGWLSCHSCHTDGHTNGGLADTFSDGSYQTPKQIPSLLGVRDANPWAWNGQFRELHAQVSASFTSTLNGDPATPPQVSDVVAFLHTLVPPPPVDEGEWIDGGREQIDRGRRLFEGLGCRRCHVPPVTYTIDLVFDVGMRDEAGLTKFNPPSLRGVGQRSRYLHDGRAQALEAVFAEYGHQLDRELSSEELDALAAFLRSL